MQAALAAGIVVVLLAMPRLGISGLLAGSPPADLGAQAGRLKPCPDRPNCVSSQASAEAQRVDALVFEGEADAALERIAALLRAMPRVRIVARAPGYLRAECVSRWWGFVDDLEFLVDSSQSRVHVRSASRLGYSDLGVNRRRVEAIRAAFERAAVER
jgi:uncharacterized protein (DUF1499 family)